jgi:DNA polymerase-3 subunit alpha
LFFFNKYLKKNKLGNDYFLDESAFKFYTEFYGEKNLREMKITEEGGTAVISQSIWDNIYKKDMDPVRDWMKKYQNEILTDLNNRLFEEIKAKYAEGNLSKWEMDSLSFYYHDHELEKLKRNAYDISDYQWLENNEIDRTFPDEKSGGEIVLYKIYRIAGTVIDKDKNKSTVVLLTPSGVVNVKVWKNQFAKWDKQIFEKDADGTKHIIEKSWFQRGTKLIITGIKRDDTFVPKKYKNTKYPLFEKILEMGDDGYIKESVTERAEEVA